MPRPANFTEACGEQEWHIDIDWLKPRAGMRNKLMELVCRRHMVHQISCGG